MSLSESGEAVVSVDPGSQYYDSTIVIIGSGPVGYRFAMELARLKQEPCEIFLFGDEPYAPYDRVKLTQLLAREIDYPDIFYRANSDGSPQLNKVNANGHTICFINARIEHVDPYLRVVSDHMGETYDYDSLIFATGSSPHIPNIAGRDLAGVYTFRHIKDAETLFSRLNKTSNIVVVGGGLLGLEAAKALKRQHVKITLVHQSPHLMNRQLDEMSAERLLAEVKAQGIDVIINDGLRGINGEVRVESATTRSGCTIDCDTVLFCTGIKPNVELARQTELKVARGILVDDQLQTSFSDIYAIGECAEHNQEVIGLVAPGLEQASILAKNLAGGELAYKGTHPFSVLKIMSMPVSSLGEVVDYHQSPHIKVSHHKKNDHTRTIVSEKGRVLGACATGDWAELQRLREAFVQQRKLHFWQLWLFKVSGRLWLKAPADDPATWPATAIICQCNGIPLSSICGNIQSGCTNVATVGAACGAGTVCGSCKPTLAKIIDWQVHENQLEPVTEAVEKPVVSIPLLAGSSIAACLALLLALIPSIPIPDSVQTPSLHWLWTENIYKQVSGFSLVGIAMVGMLLSMRKRFGWQFLGNFSRWRTLHTVFGCIALLVLFAHTGANLGHNLNRLLMINFLSVVVVGSMLGLAIVFSRGTGIGETLRKSSFWVHLVTVWPLPALLIAHVVTSYYF